MENFQPKRQSQPQIDTKEKHDFIYESFKDIYSSYGIDVMKILAFLVLCIGWFITSDKSRDFYKKNRTVRISSIIALIVLGIIHITSQHIRRMGIQVKTNLPGKGKHPKDRRFESRCRREILFRTTRFVFAVIFH